MAHQTNVIIDAPESARQGKRTDEAMSMGDNAKMLLSLMSHDEIYWV